MAWGIYGVVGVGGKGERKVRRHEGKKDVWWKKGLHPGECALLDTGTFLDLHRY